MSDVLWGGYYLPGKVDIQLHLFFFFFLNGVSFRVESILLSHGIFLIADTMASSMVFSITLGSSYISYQHLVS